MPEGNAEGEAEAKAPAEAAAGGAQAPQAAPADPTDSSAKDNVATAKESGAEAAQDGDAGEGAAAAQAEGKKRSREGDDEDDVPAKAAKKGGKAESLQLGPKHFDNPERARTYFSYLCREGPFNVLLNEYEHLVITDLLRLHPRARAKIGPGVRGFKIKELKRTKCIFAVHTDGTEIDFSYIKCLESASGVDLKRGGGRQG